MDSFDIQNDRNDRSQSPCGSGSLFSSPCSEEFVGCFFISDKKNLNFHFFFFAIQTDFRIKKTPTNFQRKASQPLQSPFFQKINGSSFESGGGMMNNNEMHLLPSSLMASSDLVLNSQPQIHSMIEQQSKLIKNQTNLVKSSIEGFERKLSMNKCKDSSEKVEKLLKQNTDQVEEFMVKNRKKCEKELSEFIQQNFSKVELGNVMMSNKIEGFILKLQNENENLLQQINKMTEKKWKQHNSAQQKRDEEMKERFKNLEGTIENLKSLVILQMNNMNAKKSNKRKRNSSKESLQEIQVVDQEENKENIKVFPSSTKRFAKPTLPKKKITQKNHQEHPKRDGLIKSGHKDIEAFRQQILNEVNKVKQKMEMNKK